MSLLSEEKIEELSREMVKGEKSVNWLASKIEAAVLEAQKGQEPVAWGLQIPGEIGFRQIWTVKDEPFNAALNRWPEAYKDAIQVPLYAAPVVQPDMVMVPREPTEAMEEAVLNCATYNVEYEEDVYLKNFSECYKFMLIAAAEGKSNAEVSGAGTASAGLPGYTAGDNTE